MLLLGKWDIPALICAICGGLGTRLYPVCARVSGLRVEAEVFSDSTYLDIGTPEDLVRAVCHFAAGTPTGQL